MKNLFFMFSITIIFQTNLFSQIQNSNETIFKRFKKEDNEYFSGIKGLREISNEVFNSSLGSKNFKLFKEIEKEDDGPEWNYKSIIYIDKYYFFLKLGKEHKVEIKDIAGNDNVPEIIIKSGCYSDGGCLEKLYIVRIVSNENITISDFGEVSLATDKLNVYDYYGIENKGYSQNKYLSELKDCQKQGKFIIIKYLYDVKTSSCSLNLLSYELSGNGFKKSIFAKKIKKVCAG